MVVIMGVLGVMSLFLFTRPVAGFALVGTLEGRVAILPGSPQRVTKQIRSGKFEGSS
jgi:hypothetical protein